MWKEYIEQKQLNDLFNSFSYNYQVAYEGHNSAAEQIGSCIENIGTNIIVYICNTVHAIISILKCPYFISTCTCIAVLVLDSG